MSAKKKNRIQNINQMLLEMACGNFFYRLERSSKNDNLEAIGITLNMLAEEIQETMLHHGYVNSNSPIVGLVQMSFVLNADGCIEIANKQACNILSIFHADIIGQPFSGLLVEKSQKVWLYTWKALEQKRLEDTSLEVVFKTRDGLVIPKMCYITSFIGKDSSAFKVLISVILHSKSQERLELDLKQGIQLFSKNKERLDNATNTTPSKPKIRLSFSDIKKIREGHHLIINNLEKDFPSLKEFALKLGTNEFKLKYGFKELYGTTVHRFLMEERLRKSKMMIQFTDQSLKSIGHATGFKSISHFSRTFKKRYGYTPSDLRKKSLNSDK